MTFHIEARFREAEIRRAAERRRQLEEARRSREDARQESRRTRRGQEPEGEGGGRAR